MADSTKIFLDFSSKVDRVSMKLQSWSMLKSGSLPKRIQELRSSIQVLQNSLPRSGAIDQIHIQERELDKLMEQEEVY